MSKFKNVNVLLVNYIQATLCFFYSQTLLRLVIDFTFRFSISFSMAILYFFDLAANIASSVMQNI